MIDPEKQDLIEACEIVRAAVNACFKDPGDEGREMGDRPAHEARCRAVLAINQGASIESAFIAGVGETAAMTMMRRLGVA